LLDVVSWRKSYVGRLGCLIPSSANCRFPFWATAFSIVGKNAYSGVVNAQHVGKKIEAVLVPFLFVNNPLRGQCGGEAAESRFYITPSGVTRFLIPVFDSY